MLWRSISLLISATPRCPAFGTQAIGCRAGECSHHHTAAPGLPPPFRHAPLPDPRLQGCVLIAAQVPAHQPDCALPRASAGSLRRRATGLRLVSDSHRMGMQSGLRSAACFLGPLHGARWGGGEAKGGEGSVVHRGSAASLCLTWRACASPLSIPIPASGEGWPDPPAHRLWHPRAGQHGQVAPLRGLAAAHVACVGLGAMQPPRPPPPAPRLVPRLGHRLGLRCCFASRAVLRPLLPPSHPSPQPPPLP